MKIAIVLVGIPILAVVGAVQSAETPLSAEQASEPVKVDTKGVTAVIRYETLLAGPLAELNGKYKLRVTEVDIAPGGYVGEHNHRGPGIRLMTVGRMQYIMPDKSVIYGPGDYFFEAGDVSHKVVNHTDATCQHLLFEMPRDVQGPSLIPPRHKTSD